MASAGKQHCADCMSAQCCSLLLKSPTVSHHRHRIDKYLDILVANRPISDVEATDHCQKGAPQDGGLPEL